MKIAIGADHGGFELKKSVIASFADALKATLQVDVRDS